MKIKIIGKGERFSPRRCSSSASRIQWTGEDGSVRVPRPQTMCFEPPLPFEAAGKAYSSTDQLTAEQADNGAWLDTYGRQVIGIRERFPCFDSYDYEHEDRYYRWWLILEPGRLTLVYTEDRSGKLWVTEDVLDLCDRLIPALDELGMILPSEQ